jgi:hypothetical protein
MVAGSAGATTSSQVVEQPGQGIPGGVDLIPAPPLDDRVTHCETGASNPEAFVPRSHLPVPYEPGFPIPPVYGFRE